MRPLSAAAGCRQAGVQELAMRAFRHGKSHLLLEFAAPRLRVCRAACLKQHAWTGSLPVDCLRRLYDLRNCRLFRDCHREGPVKFEPQLSQWQWQWCVSQVTQVAVTVSKWGSNVGPRFFRPAPANAGRPLAWKYPSVFEFRFVSFSSAVRS